MQSLHFQLKIFHPQNCVHSIIADVKRISIAKIESLSQEESKEAKILLTALTSDWLINSEGILYTLQVFALFTGTVLHIMIIYIM